jgi:hypothetical protein
MSEPQIPGYSYGSAALPDAPLSPEAFAQLQHAALWTDDDTRALQAAGPILADQVEAILDVWYGFVAAHPHLVAYFADTSSGQPIPSYLSRVRQRFGQWIIDTCTRPYDGDWLRYQQEIGLRHHRSKKNRTDGATAAPLIPLRYLIAFIAPITLTIKPFLAKTGAPAEQVEQMYAAWFKAVVLQVALWSEPYAQEGDF